MNILGAIGSIFKPAADLVDSLHTSDAERLDAKAKLLELQTHLYQEAFELEAAQLKARSEIIVAEAKSQSWIARNWRPIIMLEFGALIPLIGIGWVKFEYLAGVPAQFWTLLTIGIGGYIASRGAEKIIPDVAAAFKAREEA